MRTRGAFTLTELLITMTAGSTLLMLAVGLVHQTMHLSATARDRAAEHQTLMRLTDQFRRDAHLATEVVVDSSDSVRMSIPAQGDVSYLAQPEGCMRLLNGEPSDSTASAVLSRENYSLLRGGVVLFATLEQPGRAVLTVYRGEAAGSGSVLNQSAAALPNHSRPPTLRVEAVIGRLSSRLTAPHEEETP